MLIEPKVRGFICTTAHPIGCYENVREQINYIKKNPIPNSKVNSYRNILIVGGSTGYGLASRIFSAFSLNANTINVCLEKPPRENRTASAGWYNTASFEKIAKEENLTSSHYSVVGDAFSALAKLSVKQVIDEKFDQQGKIDLLLYSLAAPQRKDPQTGEVYRSVIKPIDADKEKVSMKGIDLSSEEVKEITLNVASAAEVESTIKVMGGADWELWVDYLKKNDLISKNFTTIAFSYIGPGLTQAVYRNGTIGKAKEDLEKKSKKLNESLSQQGGRALVSINKALVTQAAAAIPVLPLYVSILYKVMKKRSLHEGCLEQINRMFVEKIFPNQIEDNKIFLDDYEMKTEVQNEVLSIWEKITTKNLYELSDFSNYKKEFLKLFGFGLPQVDYAKEVNPVLALKNYLIAD